MLLDTQKNRGVIDAFRAGGIILVICFHVVIGLTTLLEADSLLAYVDTMPQVFNIMWQALGSEIIFLYSGFLLSYLLLRELHRAGRIDILDFFVRRFSRILPLYIIGILLYSLIRDFTALELLLNVLFVSQVFDATTIVPVGWSLEVLVQSYVLLPFVVLLFMRSKHPLALCVFFIVVFLGLRYFEFAQDPASYRTPIFELFAGTDTTPTQDAAYYLLAYRATPFLLGFLMAYVVVHKGAVISAIFERRGSTGLLLALSIAVIAGSGFLPVQDQYSFVYRIGNDQFWLWFWTIQRFVFSVGVALLSFCLWYGRSGMTDLLLRITAWPIWSNFSKNIYSIYLFHPVFLIPAAVIAFRTHLKAEIVPIDVIEVVATIAIAMTFSSLFGGLITKYVELPSQRWVRKVAARKK